MLTLEIDWSYPTTTYRRLSKFITQRKPAIALFGHQVRLRHFLIVQNTPGWRVGTHSHSDYEANIILRGLSTDSILPDQPVEPGMIILHPPHSPHSWGSRETPLLRVSIGYTIRPLLHPVPITRWPIMPELSWIMALLCEEAQQQAPGWQERCTLHMYTMFSHLLTLLKVPEETPGTVEPGTTLMEMVDRFLHDNLANPLSLDDIASYIGISRRTLTGRFRQLTGESVIRYIRLLRIERAAELLQCTQAPLAEIRVQVGLADPAYFCKCFHQQFHKSPQQYREEWQSTVTEQDSAPIGEYELGQRDHRGNQA